MAPNKSNIVNCGFLKNKAIVWFVLFLPVVFMALGGFPLMSYESDADHMIAGTELSYSSGWTINPVLSYEYNMQPLTHHFIVALRYICPFLSTEVIYCLLSIVAAILFYAGCVALLRVLFKNIHLAWFAIALFLIPELVAIATYPNSAILAAVCWIWGTVLLSKDRAWGVMLLCVAPLFRVDVLIVYPSVPFLFYYQQRGLRAAISRTAIIAAIVAIVVALSYFLLQANVFAKIDGYNEWNKRTPFISVLLSIYSFYSLVYFILLPIGITLMIKKREYAMLLFTLIPICLLHYFYISMGNAPKRYLYLVPFVAIFGVYALRWIFSQERKAVIRYSFIVILFLQLFVSVRVDVPGKPWLNEPTSPLKLGPVVPLYHGTSRNLTVGLGAGQVLPTADEIMVATGNAAYPLYVIEYKQSLQQKINKISQALDSVDGDFDIVWNSWKDQFIYTGMLIAQGASYTPVSERGFNYTITDKRKRTIHVYCKVTQGGDDKTYAERVFREFSNNPRDVYVVSVVEAHLYTYKQMASQGRLERINDNVYKLIK